MLFHLADHTYMHNHTSHKVLSLPLPAKHLLPFGQMYIGSTWHSFLLRQISNGSLESKSHQKNPYSIHMLHSPNHILLCYSSMNIDTILFVVFAFCNSNCSVSEFPSICSLVLIRRNNLRYSVFLVLNCSLLINNQEVHCNCTGFFCKSSGTRSIQFYLIVKSS